jgi:hypothetical protein
MNTLPPIIDVLKTKCVDTLLPKVDKMKAKCVNTLPPIVDEIKTKCVNKGYLLKSSKEKSNKIKWHHLGR